MKGPSSPLPLPLPGQTNHVLHPRVPLRFPRGYSRLPLRGSPPHPGRPVWHSRPRLCTFARGTPISARHSRGRLCHMGLFRMAPHLRPREGPRNVATGGAPGGAAAEAQPVETVILFSLFRPGRGEGIDGDERSVISASSAPAGADQSRPPSTGSAALPPWLQSSAPAGQPSPSRKTCVAQPPSAVHLGKRTLIPARHSRGRLCTCARGPDSGKAQPRAAVPHGSLPNGTALSRNPVCSKAAHPTRSVKPHAIEHPWADPHDL